MKKIFKLTCVGDDKPEVKAYLDELHKKLLEDSYFADAQKSYDIFQETGLMPDCEMIDNMGEYFLDLITFGKSSTRVMLDSKGKLHFEIIRE